MPTYDYRCEHCAHELELFQNISEAPKKKCPKCGRLKLRRAIGGGAGFLFKGSGFYLTDYRSSSYKQAAEAEKKSSESKGETKPAQKPAPPAEAKGKGEESAA
jgi:putative FmdB family regulatory protein